MFSPLYSPFDPFVQYPAQRRVRPSAIPSAYYQRAHPEEFFTPQYRVARPKTYGQQTPQRYYPENYYTPVSRNMSSNNRTGYDSSQTTTSSESSDSEQDDWNLLRSMLPDSLPANRQYGASHNKSHNNLKPRQGHRASNKSHRHPSQQLLEAQRQQEAIQRFQRNRAAKIIQRQWRQHHERQRDEASKKIAEFIRSRIEIRQARQILQCLRTLHSFEDELNLLHERQGSRVFKHPLKFAPDSTPDSIKILPVKENQSYLGYEDALLKLLIRIDGVDSMGSGLVRTTRKSLVNKTQQFLDALDEYKKAQYSQI
ncbi:hypothetical protein K493DRAFT_310995, partial [Basidiobolus meristosporus CBS 931.73]